MTDETAPTRRFSRERMDTDVHELLTSAILEAAERAAARAVEATRECDAEASQRLSTESGERLAKLKKDLEKVAITEVTKHGRRVGRRVVAWVTAIVTTLATAGGATAWKLAGPEQAVERAERAANKAEDTKAQVERAVTDAIEHERSQVRRALVDGRLDVLDERVGRVESTTASTNAKVDQLMDAVMGRAGATKAREQAEHEAQASTAGP